MKSFCKLLYLLTFTLIVSSCNKKIYLTADIRNIIEAKNNDLKKLQYYIDNDVVLKRYINSDTARVIGGNIMFQNGIYLETVTLKANTKGVCTAVYPNSLNVAFEMGNDKSITFAIPKFIDNFHVYQMLNEDKYGNETTAIRYDGLDYNLVVKHGYLPRLMIRKRLLEKEDRVDRTMKGRKVH